MTQSNKQVFRLGADEVAFLRIEHLSILAASHGPENIPFVARAVGRRFSADTQRLTLFFPASDANDLIEHANRNGMVAAVFALPSTHQALQLKGSDARAERPSRSDCELVSAYCRAFIEHLVQLGYPRNIFEALMDLAPDDLAAISFTPVAAFSQTPGPGAGRAIGATP